MPFFHVGSVGDVAQNGARYVKKNKTQANDSNNVASDPEQGRVVLQAPDGAIYTDTPLTPVQVGAATVNLSREPK